MNGEIFEKINRFAHDAVWGAPTVALFVVCGIFFTVRLGGFRLKRAFRGSASKRRGGISGAAALCTSLAATLGTGNIVGVAGAMCAGGAGAVFWMWISAILGMAIHYAETYLSVKYRKHTPDGYRGGPMFYIKHGLGSPAAAVLYAAFCLLASFGTGNLAQSNSVCETLFDTFGVSRWISAVVLAVLVLAVALGGMKRAASVSVRLIPALSAVYCIGALWVIFANLKSVPSAFYQIFSEAFSLESAAGGAVGLALAKSVKFGIARGIFGNEAGMGSSTIIHASADAKSPEEQGAWAVLEVFIDTIVVCTLTALAILTSGVELSVSSASRAFSSVMGGSGGAVVALCLALFGFASIVGWSQYGERCAEFIAGKRAATIYRVVFALCVVLGGVFSSEGIWLLSDTFNGLMTIPNLAAILALSGELPRWRKPKDKIKQ